MEIKNFYDYQKKALETNTYPDDKGLLLVTIGLGEEIGELFDKIREFKNRIAIVKIKEDEFKKMKKSIKKEIGDVFWYLAIIFHYLNASFNTIIFDEKIEIKYTYKIYDNFYKYIVENYFKFLGKIKKRYRDNVENVEDCVSLLSFIYENILKTCELFGFSQKEILELNIKKLADRKKRGKIQGNGDER